MQTEFKKVSGEEIQKLFEFTRKHYVEFYDLQVELVDHLANGIEEQWKVGNKLSFEDALQREFKKFGIFGFTGVVEERQKAMYKRYHKIIRGYFITFFKLPKIVATLGCMYLMFLFLLKVPYAVTISMALVLLLIIRTMYSVVKNKRAHKKQDKRFLFKEIILAYGAGVPFLSLPLNFLNLSNIFIDKYDVITYKFAAVLSAVLVLYGIYVYIILYVIPKNAEKYLLEVYPEYKLMQKM